MPLRCVKRGGDKQMIAWLKNRLSLQSVHMFSHTEAKHAFSFIEMSTREAGGADREREDAYLFIRASTRTPGRTLQLLWNYCAHCRCEESASSLSRVDLRQAPRTPSLNVISPNSDVAICRLVIHLHAMCAWSRQRPKERCIRPKEGHFWRPTDPQLCSQHVRFQWVMALSITICCYINWGNNCIQPCNVLIQISWPRTLNINIIINFIWPMASAALCRISPYRQMLW